MKKTLLFVLLLALSACSLPKAGRLQWEDAAGEQARLFGDAPVEMHLRVDMQELEKTLKVREFVPGELRYNGLVWKNIGVRYRGGVFSKGRPKRAFKLKFNTAPGRHFYGLERLNLNMERNDPTFVREKIACELLRGLGVPAPRIGYVRLYVNGVYRGLYLNMEQIDARFVKTHLGLSGGILYKAGWPACLRVNPQSGQPETEYFPVKELPLNLKRERKRLVAAQEAVAAAKKRGDTAAMARLSPEVARLRRSFLEAQAAPLARLIRLLHDSAPGRLAAELPPRFAVEGFLKVLAVHTLIAAWDNYHMTPGNFYLYWDPAGDRIHWIAYDYDNSFGVDFWGIDWQNAPLLDFTPRTNGSEDRPLIDKVLAVPAWRTQLLRRIRGLLDGPFREEALMARARRLQALIAPAVREEMESRRNYSKEPGGYRLFADNLEKTAGTGSRFFQGFLPHVRGRIAAAQAQLPALEAGRAPARLHNNGRRQDALAVAPLARDRLLPGTEHWFGIAPVGGVTNALLVKSLSAQVRAALVAPDGRQRELVLKPGLQLFHLEPGDPFRMLRLQATGAFSVLVELVWLPVLPASSGTRFRLPAAAGRLAGQGQPGAALPPAGRGLTVVAFRREGARLVRHSAPLQRDAAGMLAATLPLPSGRWLYHFVVPGFGPLPDPAHVRLQWGGAAERLVP